MFLGVLGCSGRCRLEVGVECVNLRLLVGEVARHDQCWLHKIHFVLLGALAGTDSQVGLLGELSLEVVEGLKGGETLITGPFKALREIKPGDLVKVEKAKTKDGSPR